MPHRDVVSRTVLIMGYRDVRSHHDALLVFEHMQYTGVVPNRVTMVNALAACAHFGAIQMRWRGVGVFMRGMPFGPTKAMRASLLVCSKAQRELAGRKLVELVADNTAYYVHLSNLYTELGRWKDVEKVRGMMKNRHLTKELGCSSVEFEHQRHVSELLA
ncbi:hypothetical protein RJT34_19422 [Clitoria ternatea]|uniref:Pentatricopeptide repeat-containing protein n=1 Tax=Clitoria ternatea TaxID=43366 RepID=A0AAN9P3Q1_CLITE